MKKQSDVAHLRERIDREQEALRNALAGLMYVGGHAQINRRYRAVDEHYEKLAALVGDRQAFDWFMHVDIPRSERAEDKE